MRVTLLTTRHLTVAVAAVVVAGVGAAGTATTALSVPGRANTNPSISARGAFVVGHVGGRHGRRCDRRLRGREPGRRPNVQ